jgi:hypothetical protein
MTAPATDTDLLLEDFPGLETEEAPRGSLLQKVILKGAIIVGYPIDYTIMVLNWRPIRAVRNWFCALLFFFSFFRRFVLICCIVLLTNSSFSGVFLFLVDYYCELCFPLFMLILTAESFPFYFRYLAFPLLTYMSFIAHKHNYHPFYLAFIPNPPAYRGFIGDCLIRIARSFEK